MARTKGSRNKNSRARPYASTLSDPDRLKLLANLIVDKLLEDQVAGQLIDKTMLAVDHG